jgi:hypothetical protein
MGHAKISCHTVRDGRANTVVYYLYQKTTSMPARFVPQLHIPSGTFELDFYLKAFDASLLRSWKNEDGSYHVAEMEIDGAMFHFHEDKPAVGHLTPPALMVSPQSLDSWSTMLTG